MQLIHLRLLEEAEFVRLAAISDIAHVFGPGNVLADAVSRDYFDMVEGLSASATPRTNGSSCDLATRADCALASRPLSKVESQCSRSHRHANKGSYGPPTNERASQFPSSRQSTDTPPTPRYSTPTNAPVSFVSFAARPPAPAHHARAVRPAPRSPSAPITAPSPVPALTTNAKPPPPSAAASNVARFALRRDSPSAFPKSLAPSRRRLRAFPTSVRLCSALLGLRPSPLSLFAPAPLRLRLSRTRFMCCLLRRAVDHDQWLPPSSRTRPTCSPFFNATRRNTRSVLATLACSPVSCVTSAPQSDAQSAPTRNAKICVFSDHDVNSWVACWTFYLLTPGRGMPGA